MDLPFVDNGKTISPDSKTWRCEATGVQPEDGNLWMNLSDGFIGGGRRNWDGTGGTGGGLQHYNELKQQSAAGAGPHFPLVVKLGTIGQGSEPDCYSYAPDEDRMVKVPNLAELLLRRGLNISNMSRSTLSTAELEVKLNMSYDFSAICEEGDNGTPLQNYEGPGVHGLKNLGNSCYMNSTVQLLLSGAVPELAARYGGDAQRHAVARGNPVSVPEPAEDVLLQVEKVVSAIQSGRHCDPEGEAKDRDADRDRDDPRFQLAPNMFRRAIAKGYVYSTAT